MLDLKIIKQRALIMRSSLASQEEKHEAYDHASDDILKLCSAIETLQNTLNSDTVLIAKQLEAIRLTPINLDGPLDLLAEEISTLLYGYAKKYSEHQLWDAAALPTALKILIHIDKYLQRQLEEMKNNHAEVV